MLWREAKEGVFMLKTWMEAVLTSPRGLEMASESSQSVLTV